MKKLIVFLCAIFLVFGMTSLAGALTWTGSVNSTTGWLDVDKSQPTEDFYLCWAASASNILSYTGWDGGPGLMTEDEIFDDYIDYWDNEVGNPRYAVEWWFTGVNAHQLDANWAHLTDTSHTGFYPTYFSNWHSTSPGSDLGNIESYLSNDYGVSIWVEAYGGHFLTVWGADVSDGKIWVTDSDYADPGITEYSVSGMEIQDYQGVAGWNPGIGTVYGLAQIGAGIDPILRDEGPSAPVPEPATLFLLGSGLMGLFGLGRKKFFRR